MKNKVIKIVIAAGYTKIFASLVILICAAALTGWYSNRMFLTRFVEHHIPIAPSTAFVFIVLSSGIIFYNNSGIKIRNKILAGICSLIVLITASILIITINMNHYSSLEHPFLNLPDASKTFLLGHMSIATAILFIIGGLSLLLRIFNKINLSFYLAVLLFILSFIFILGYFFDVPFMYDGTTIPPALLTVSSFLFSSLCLIAITPQNQRIMKKITSDSTSAKLVRVFVPVIVILNILQGIIMFQLLPRYYINPVAAVSVFSFLSVFIVIVIISYVSGQTGRHFDEITEKLKESREEMSRILENSMDGILLTAPDGSVYSANPAACKMFGRSEKELCEVGREGVVDLSDPRLEQFVKMRNEKGKANTEINLLRKDGSKFPAEVTSALFKDKHGNLKSSMIIRDVTERKKVEVALKKSEEKYRSIFKNSALGIFRSSPEGRYEEVNEAFANMLGFDSPQKMIDEVTDISKLYKHPEDREKIKKEFADKGFVQDYEIVANHPHKDTVWISVNGKQQQDPDGYIYYEGTIQDITEKKLAEEKLIESEKGLKEAQRLAEIGSWYFNLETGEVTMSEEMFRLTGITENDPWQNVADHEKYYMPESWQRFRGAVERARKTGENYEIELEFADKTAGRRYAIVRGEAIFDENKHVIALRGTLQDITERKEAENKLEDYKNHLAELVKERTAELEKQNKELERFNKLFVGREFRIKELKEKIKDLEKELRNRNS